MEVVPVAIRKYNLFGDSLFVAYIVGNFEYLVLISLYRKYEPASTQHDLKQPQPVVRYKKTNIGEPERTDCKRPKAQDNQSSLFQFPFIHIMVHLFL